MCARFNQIIQEREKEFEDQIFYLALAQQQSIGQPTEERPFAGIKPEMI